MATRAVFDCALASRTASPAVRSALEKNRLGIGGGQRVEELRVDPAVALALVWPIESCADRHRLWLVGDSFAAQFPIHSSRNG